ncbi:hypothetical protein GCM10009777_39470 [Microbacterium pumilum]|uniref:Uncharacterized protein n=2 Tax=Microbacterium pumilum TaxID=344165 RepID=A0ABN2T407_9MICO
MRPTIYDAAELALIRSGLEDPDPVERASTAGLLLAQPTTDDQVRERLRRLLSDQSVVDFPSPAVAGELRLLAGLALAVAAEAAGEPGEVRLRAAPPVVRPWVLLPEREYVLRGRTLIDELLEELPAPERWEPIRPIEAADAWEEDLFSKDAAVLVNALKTVRDAPTGEPRVVATLEGLLNDRRIAALTIPYRFGEIRVLAAAALAAERADTGDARPVRLKECPPLLGTDDLWKLAEAHRIDTSIRSEPELYAALRDAGALPLTDLELTAPAYLGWL